MERWDRAEKLNLSPPADVRRILEERKDDAAFAECVWERLVECGSWTLWYYNRMTVAMLTTPKQEQIH